MDKRIGLFASLTALLAMGSAHAQITCPYVPITGLPVQKATLINPETGHTFDVYRATGITWDDARLFVDCLPTVGSATTKAHLATITSFSENQWIVDLLLTPVLGQLEGGRTQVWVGGFRDPASLPEFGWRWVNSEGPFSGVNGGIGYTNWSSSPGQVEPNNTGGSENAVTLGRYSTNLYGWNDEGAAVGSIGGFIVEYDTPRTSADCAGDTTEACTTVKGQTLTFPAGSFNQTTGNIQFTAYEFNDPRIDPDTGKCSVNRGGPLSLFTDPAFDGNALTIPDYLCGSPKFLVVKVNSENLSILKGAVLVENKTDIVLPDNLWKCFDPILGRIPALTGPFLDPQFQDVVVWQSTDGSLMLEDQLGTGIYQGAATEATNGCGSTVAKVRGASYFVVGLHIDFNLGYDYPANKAQNYAQFVALTKYKLSLLKQSVANARAAGQVKNPDGQAMASQVQNAISKLAVNDPAGALKSMQQFVSKVNSSTYFPPTNPLDKFNYNGDHLMRGENLVFMLRVKVVPYKPVP